MSYKSKSQEKAAFVRGFVTKFLTDLGATKESLANSNLGDELAKLAADHQLPTSIQHAVDQAAGLKARGELAQGNLLTHVATPAAAGAIAGAGLARLFRPDDVEVDNLQKKELLMQYDSAINELNRRIATRMA